MWIGGHPVVILGWWQLMNRDPAGRLPQIVLYSTQGFILRGKWMKMLFRQRTENVIWPVLLIVPVFF